MRRCDYCNTVRFDRHLSPEVVMLQTEDGEMIQAEVFVCVDDLAEECEENRKQMEAAEAEYEKFLAEQEAGTELAQEQEEAREEEACASTSASKKSSNKSKKTQKKSKEKSKKRSKSKD